MSAKNATLLARPVLFAVLLLVLAGACFFFGADTPVTTYVFASLLLFVSGISLVLFRRSGIPRAFIMAIILISFWAIYDIRADRFFRALPEYFVMISAGGVFCVAALAGKRADRPHLWWQAILLVFLCFSIWAFCDFILNPDMIHGQPRPYHQDRLSGAFLSANTAATFFGIGLIASVVSLLRSLSRVSVRSLIVIIETLFRHGLIATLTLLFCGVCLVLTASRAGAVFALCALLVLVTWEVLAGRLTQATAPKYSAFRITAAVTGCVIILAALFWAVSGDVAGARYAELEEDANLRWVMFNAYWDAASAAPFFGHGFGSFNAVNNYVMTAENAHILATQGAAHNLALQWLLQVGWIGTGLAGALLFSVLSRIFSGISLRRRFHPYLRGALCIAGFVLAHGMVDYALEIPGLMWWWALILGFGYGIASGFRKSTKRGQVFW